MKSWIDDYKTDYYNSSFSFHNIVISKSHKIWSTTCCSDAPSSSKLTKRPKQSAGKRKANISEECEAGYGCDAAVYSATETCFPLHTPPYHLIAFWLQPGNDVIQTVRSYSDELASAVITAFLALSASFLPSPTKPSIMSVSADVFQDRSHVGRDSQ